MNGRALAALLIALAAAGCGSTAGADHLDAAMADGGGADVAIVDGAPDLATVDDAAVGVDVVSMDAASSPEAAGADAANATCALVCGVAAQLNCPVKVDCVGACLREWDGDCKNTTRAFFACAVSATAADYHCSPEGYALLDANVCSGEMMAIATCNRSGLDPIATDGGLGQ